MILLCLAACLPPILPDTGVVPDSGGTADSSDTDSSDTDSTDTDTGDTGESIDDADHDGSKVPDDCNDAEASIHPGAAEQVNWVDEDCDGNLVESASSSGGVDVGDVGALLSLCAFGGGLVDTRVAAGLFNSHQVAVTTTTDVSDGVIAATSLISYSNADSFGFDVQAMDVDIDSAQDLLIGDPGTPGAYWVADSTDLAAGGALNAATLPMLSDPRGLGRLGFAATQLGTTLAVSSLEATGPTGYLIDGADFANGTLSDVTEGTSIPSTPSYEGLGANLGGFEVTGDGMPDLIVASPASGGARGSILLFSGDGLSTSGEVLSPDDANASLVGARVGDALGGGTLGAGDLNNDGDADIFVTTHALSTDRQFYALPGGAIWTSGNVESASLSIVSGVQSVGDGAVSYPSSTAYDVDGDFAFELFAGSPGESPGRVYIFSGAELGAGGSYTTADAGTGILGDTGGDAFGQVLTVGAGESTPALLVGAPGEGAGSLWYFDLNF